MVGVFYYFTTLILSFSIWTSLCPTTTPRMGISLASKLHFDCLKYRLCFSATFRKCIILSSSFFLCFGQISQSYLCSLPVSIYIVASWIYWFIILEMFLEELHSPKYITWGSNSPLFVKKAAFYSFPSFIQMLLYSQIKSNLLKYLASFSLSITSLINGSGVLSLIVT